MSRSGYPRRIKMPWINDSIITGDTATRVRSSQYGIMPSGKDGRMLRGMTRLARDWKT